MRHPPRPPRRSASVAALLALTLAAGLLPVATAAAFTVDPANVWINEIHYDNAGTDAGEAIEIAGPAGTNLAGWTIYLHNGVGGTIYGSELLTGTIPDQENGFGTLSFPIGGIQNGAPDGVALADGSTLVQFLSYEGSFTASDFGIANGTTSTDIGVDQEPPPAVGLSLGLTGTGTTYQGFTWSGPSASSFGSPNQGQTLGTPPDDEAPTVTDTNPEDDATGVAIDPAISISFSEDVTLGATAISVDCTLTDGVTPSIAGGPQDYDVSLAPDLQEGETCTLTVAADEVGDTDGVDPEHMAADYVFSFTTVTPITTPDVNISQVYGGGGNTGAFYRQDFIELYNPGSSAVSLSGWSIQYASASGTTWQVTDLVGSIPAGGHYLIREAAGSGGVSGVPTPDASGTIAMGSGSGKVALVSGTTALAGACPTGGAIVDLVGYGTANCFEGSGATAALTNSTAALRAGDGATDTDNNAADFTLGAPNPRPTVDPAPAVESTSPTDGATNLPTAGNVSISFAERVTVTDPWISIVCASTGAHAATVSTTNQVTYVVDPSVDFGEGESCTVTVHAANVVDQDGQDPPDQMPADHVFSFITADPELCGEPVTPIHTIQGSGASSPFVGQSVALEGVVVGDYQADEEFEGFFVQDEDADADGDPTTSEGVFVFDDLLGVPVASGDHVRVRGTVSEFNGRTEVGSVSLVLVCGAGTPVTPAEPTLPVASLADWEAFEGMLVTIDQQLTVTETFTLGRFGEVALSVNGRLQNPTSVTPPGAAAQALQSLNDRSRILLDDGNSLQNIDPTRYPTGGLTADNTLRIGDTVNGALTGVLDFAFSVYRIQPVGPIDFAGDNPRPAAPAVVGGNIKVAAANVLNYFTTLDTNPGSDNGPNICGPSASLECRGASTTFELDRQPAKIVSALTGLDADIVGLMEIENNDHEAVADLVSALNAALGAGTYDYVDTGTIGTDAIKLALIYRTAAVTPVGDYAILDSSVDPAFIDTRNRPSLAQTFERNATGARITVVVNHLKSKGSPCSGDPDDGDGQGNCKDTRTAAAGALAAWLATDPTDSGDPDVLIIGDLNSYAREDPIHELESAGYVNLIAAKQGSDAYSYVFGGQSGYLDHALASPSLAAQATGATDWHINADEPVVLDYNTDFKSANHVSTLYAPNAFRSSDHDPLLVGMQLDAPPTVEANGPYEVIEGQSITVSATGTEPDGQPLTYAWDLDGDGSFETPGQSVTFSAAGLTAPDSRTIAVEVTGPTGLSGTNTATVHIIWDFGGITGPVDPNGANVVTAGQAVPVKFSLDGNQGPAILDGSPMFQTTRCSDGTAIGAPVAVTGSGPSYDPVADTYTYVWKTDKSQAGTCGTLVITLTDGTSHTSTFRFKP